MRLFRTACGAVCLAVLALCVGCHEPDYRNEVVGNGQGGVEIRKVPKDAPAADDNSINASIDQRIQALEDQVRRANAEIARLKKMKAAGENAPS